MRQDFLMAMEVVEVAMGRIRRTWTLRTGGNIADDDDPYTSKHHEWCDTVDTDRAQYLDTKELRDG